MEGGTGDVGATALDIFRSGYIRTIPNDAFSSVSLAVKEAPTREERAAERAQARKARTDYHVRAGVPPSHAAS